MKKLICAMLAVLLLVSLSACGKKQAKEAPQMQEVFEQMKPHLPAESEAFDPQYVFDAYGVKPEDCKQQVVTSFYDGSQTSEVWLIEAVSADALKSIREMAQARVDSLCEQFKSYDMIAYDLAEDARLETEGNCLVLIISENADALMEIYSKS